MMRVSVLEPVFVKTIPRELELGRLYVSMEYGTISHSCCCGCGNEVVTPLTPTDWSLTFDGEHISLWPSVGSWNLPCQSHYVVKSSRVIEAGPWRREKIDEQLAREKAARAKRYGHEFEQYEPAQAAPTRVVDAHVPMQERPIGFWKRLWKMVR
ncbi:DUF6527 family protein [Paraburkholderia fungorum]|uniref:DUF6527 family protein n=1 Tax=Paraburkholderia fungorum TaxID=134537 RepID=UPI0038B9233A